MEQIFHDYNLLKIVIFIFPIYLLCFALYHLVKNENLESNQKIIWILVIFFFNFIGSLIYLFVHNRRSKSL